ncbi:hypothetical protein A9Q84_11050 [Halobacteriovorax marinus]|uniref:Major facilitator superfamily (MFS) profile domain-containing protein n=1 Tax=Halobacteriovorax marinus TaxID=97084 RepID=A0A1Y5F7H3_9BACT|nr:hypothetical protein A9Q84_11050 [Halobacteriovorax marinus]
MQEVFELQAIFSFFVLIFELPSGYLADLIGRRNTLISASFIHAIGFSLLPLTNDFYSLIFVQILLGIGVSLFSGTDISIIYDSLHAMKNEVYKDNEATLIGKKIFYSQTSEAVAAIVGGFLVVYSLNTPAYFQAVFCWLPFFVAWTIKEPPRELLSSKKHKENWIHIIKSLFKQGAFLNLIILNTIFYSAVTLVAVWAFQDYWRLQGIEYKYFGYLWFSTNIVVAIVAKFAHRFEIRFGSTVALVTIGLLPIIGFFGMGFFGGVVGVFFCFAFQFCRGLSQVILKDALNKRVGGEMRATANSIVGLGMRIVFIIFGPILGWFIDNKGYEAGFNFFAVLLCVVFVLFLIPLLKLKNEFRT